MKQKQKQNKYRHGWYPNRLERYLFRSIECDFYKVKPQYINETIGFITMGWKRDEKVLCYYYKNEYNIVFTNICWIKDAKKIFNNPFRFLRKTKWYKKVWKHLHT
jgi:hypothetical protein